MIARRSTPEDVRWAYSLLLGREPEDPRALIVRATQYPDRLQMVLSFMHSLEFRYRTNGRQYPSVDASVIDEFWCNGLTGQSGFVTDFLGGRTRISVSPGAAALDGEIEGLPIPENFFGTLPEWTAALSGVRIAAQAGGTRFCCVEVGAAWGPWLVATSLAARARGFKEFRLIGAEAAPELCARLKMHAEDNGFAATEVSVRNVAVLRAEGMAAFPTASGLASGVNSRAELLTAPEAPREGQLVVPAITLASLIADEGQVDLLVVSVNGDELDVLSTANLNSSQIRTMMVVTQDLDTDAGLWRIMSEAGWRNAVASPCRLKQDLHYAPIVRTEQAGCQLWINPAALPLR